MLGDFGVLLGGSSAFFGFCFVCQFASVLVEFLQVFEFGRRVLEN